MQTYAHDLNSFFSIHGYTCIKWFTLVNIQTFSCSCNFVARKFSIVCNAHFVAKLSQEAGNIANTNGAQGLPRGRHSGKNTKVAPSVFRSYSYALTGKLYRSTYTYLLKSSTGNTSIITESINLCLPSYPVEAWYLNQKQSRIYCYTHSWFIYVFILIFLLINFSCYFSFVMCMDVYRVFVKAL